MKLTNPAFRRVAACAVVAAALAVLLFWNRADRVVRETQELAPVHVFSDEAPGESVSVSEKRLPVVAERPLPVGSSSATHEWTEGDASDPEVIGKLAHNPEEFIRMVEENDRIHRRQLVYRNETADESVRRSRILGEPLRQLTLPSLDGHELTFEIARADVDPSGNSGTFAGRLEGRPDSQVTLAFKEGREAFTVISPGDELYLQADPREPGQLIVKAINPATYIQGQCGNPDHNH